MLYYSDSQVGFMWCLEYCSIWKLFHNYFVYGKRWKIRRIIAAPCVLPFGWDASFKSFPHFIWKLIWKPLGNRGFPPLFQDSQQQQRYLSHHFRTKREGGGYLRLLWILWICPPRKNRKVKSEKGKALSKQIRSMQYTTDSRQRTDIAHSFMDCFRDFGAATKIGLKAKHEWWQGETRWPCTEENASQCNKP